MFSRAAARKTIHLRDGEGATVELHYILRNYLKAKEIQMQLLVIESFQHQL